MSPLVSTMARSAKGQTDWKRSKVPAINRGRIRRHGIACRTRSVENKKCTGGKGSLSMRRAICCACCCTRSCCCGVRLASALTGSADRALSGSVGCTSDAERASVCRTYKKRADTVAARHSLHDPVNLAAHTVQGQRHRWSCG